MNQRSRRVHVNRVNEFNEFIAKMLYLDVLEATLFTGNVPRISHIMLMLEKYDLPATTENIETITSYSEQIISSIRMIVAGALLNQDD